VSVPVSVSVCGSYPSGIVTLHMYNERRQTSRTRMPGPSTPSPIFLFFVYRVCLTPPPTACAYSGFLCACSVSLTHARFPFFTSPLCSRYIDKLLGGCTCMSRSSVLRTICDDVCHRTSSTHTSVCVGCRSRRTHTFTHKHTHIRTCSLSLSHTHTHTCVCVSPPTLSLTLL